MFGLSALYHRGNWSDAPRRWMRALDHAGIFVLIAGTYTAFGLLVLDGAWRWVVLGIVWGGRHAPSASLAWPAPPRWVTGALALAIGWVGVVVAPQLVIELGAGGIALVVAGGLAYTPARDLRVRADPFPRRSAITRSSTCS